MDSQTHTQRYKCVWTKTTEFSGCLSLSCVWPGQRASLRQNLSDPGIPKETQISPEFLVDLRLMLHRGNTRHTFTRHWAKHLVPTSGDHLLLSPPEGFNVLSYSFSCLCSTLSWLLATTAASSWLHVCFRFLTWETQQTSCGNVEAARRNPLWNILVLFLFVKGCLVVLKWCSIKRFSIVSTSSSVVTSVFVQVGLMAHRTTATLLFLRTLPPLIFNMTAKKHPCYHTQCLQKVFITFDLPYFITNVRINTSQKVGLYMAELAFWRV